MNYYLVHWTIHDGENEYDEYAVAELKQKPASDSALFKTIIEDDYFATEKNPLKQDPMDADRYELPCDYREVELSRIEEIPARDAVVLKKYNVVFDYRD